VKNAWCLRVCCGRIGDVRGGLARRPVPYHAAYVPDFSNWQDRKSYQTEFSRLLRDIKRWSFLFSGLAAPATECIGSNRKARRRGEGKPPSVKFGYDAL
jgi:hypothetical protein